MTLEITPLQVEDVADVHALAQLCLPEAWSEAALAALPENPLAHFFVARRDGVLLGFCFMYLVADEGQIMEIATDPAHRRQGIARQLLSHLLADGQAHGATLFTLEVRAQNAAAQALYASLGFVADGVRRNYYRNPTDDAILMSKRF